MTSTPQLLLSSPVDVLAAVPYLLGFHPDESLVAIGLGGAPPSGRLCLTTRWDLPLDPGSTARLIPLLRREAVNRLLLVGYGPGPAVTPAIDTVRALAADAGMEVTEALRAENGRYWSYVCAAAGCCPAEGTPYDPAASPVPAQATLNGMVALPDRQALEESVAPCTGPPRRAIREATRRAVAEMTERVRTCRDADALAREYVAEGLGRVRGAVRAHRSALRLTDDDAARLGLALSVVRVRDEAWTLMDDADLRHHLALWQDMTRRLEPRFVPPAASLLGLAAWRHGDCALAALALGRALDADPGYSMANLLRHALCHLVSPAVLRDRTPSPVDLDGAMGAPRMSWLLPTVALLEEPSSGEPLSAAHAETGGRGRRPPGRGATRGAP